MSNNYENNIGKEFSINVLKIQTYVIDMDYLEKWIALISKKFCIIY